MFQLISGRAPKASSSGLDFVSVPIRMGSDNKRRQRQSTFRTDLSEDQGFQDCTGSFVWHGLLLSDHQVHLMGLLVMIRTICAFAAGFTLVAWIGFDLSPSYVDKDRILREPFALIPLGAASVAITLGTGAFL